MGHGFQAAVTMSQYRFLLRTIARPGTARRAAGVLRWPWCRCRAAGP
ncbi:hypothetical protein AB0M32_09600 [Streptomyces sp. NPDC051985]